MTTDLEVRAAASPAFLPGEHQSQRIWKLANAIASTDFVPKSLRGNPPAIMAAMLTGRELGILPMRALRQVNIIEGQPSPSPELMMALALKAGHEVDVVETTRTRCVVEVRRAEWPEDRRRRLEWDIDDAVAADLCTIDANGQVRARSKSGSKLPWEKYTRAMLRSRAVSEACRTWLPDVVDGASYVPEELGAPVTGDGHAQELVDAADARGDTYDPLEGEADDVRAAVAQAMGDDEAADDDVVDAEIVDDEPGEGEPDPEPEVDPGLAPCTACGELIAGEHDCQDTADPHPEVDTQPAVEAPHPDGWDVPAKTEDDDPQPFDWRAYAGERDVKLVEVLQSLRADWPSNSQWNKPNRSKDIDALAADDVMADIVRAAIDDAKGA